jgi:UDP-N-acetylmuramoyl-tripeptide--D-alanyl-D-alanine ligase
MEDLSVNEIKDMTGGRVVLGEPHTLINRIATDSRKIKPGELFWALPGNKYDGHDFILEALNKGACGVVISKEKLAQQLKEIYSRSTTPVVILLVPNTLIALQTLAHCYRKKFSLHLVGITGSNGKTTTKEIIAQILSAKFKVLKNEGNFNNHIGLPLSLLDLSSQHQVAVLELGMNQRGEIARLCEIALPNIGVITNIGPSHLEFLGSLEGVQEAKAELVRALTARDLLILNADDERVSSFQDWFSGKVLLFGLSPQAHIWADQIELRKERGCNFMLYAPGGEKIQVSLPLMGRFNIYNALAGAAIGYHFQIPLEEIKAALEEFRGIKMRLQPYYLPKNILLIDDTYNANPQSLQYALDTLMSCGSIPGRSVLVVGDMLELGKDSEKWHRTIGKKIAQSGLDFLITFGSMASLIADEAIKEGMDKEKVFVGKDQEGISLWLRDQLREGDRVLIKGSRAMAMDKIVAALLALREER